MQMTTRRAKGTFFKTRMYVGSIFCFQLGICLLHLLTLIRADDLDLEILPFVQRIPEFEPRGKKVNKDY